MNTSNVETIPISYSDIEQAAQRLDGVAHRTPVMTSRTLNEICGCEIFLKCENYQRMGAFKFRGAYNALSQLDDEQKRHGVITFSSGNHAQAVALSGKLLNIPAVIVMPKDAPKVKLNGTKGYGAEVLLYDRSEEKREEIAKEIQKERGMVLIPPFDHPHIMAGQGTAAKELFEDVGSLDALLVPCGGGGLISGSAISATHFSPECEVYGVEPEAGNDGQQSFESGQLISIPTPKTIADGAQTNSLGDLTLAVILKHVKQMLTATDAELIRTMFFLYERMKMVVEPTATLGLAPVFNKNLDLSGKRVGIILSGGNVDLKALGDLFSTID